MLKKTMSCLVILAMLMSSACSEMGNYAHTSAVHDGMRALGLAQMPNGTYEFRLCEVAEAYTPEMLAEKCINPLVAADGLPLVFNEIPERPGTLVAHIGNWDSYDRVCSLVGLFFLWHRSLLRQPQSNQPADQRGLHRELGEFVESFQGISAL